MGYGMITNTKGIKAPTARNWVSTINQNRAKDIQNMKDRQTTKYATMKYSLLAGLSKVVRGNSNNTITGGNAPLNVFNKTAGVVPQYTKAYVPSNIPPKNNKERIALAGTLPTDTEWIVWNGTNQLVQVDGSVSIAPTDSNASVVRLQIHLKDKMVGTVKVNGLNDQIPQSAVIVHVKQVNSGNTTKEIQVSWRGYINADDTLKLMIDRLDGTGEINMKIHTATLTVKTLPMS